LLVFLLGSPALVSSAHLISMEPAQQQAFGIVLATPARAGESQSRRYPAQVTVPNRQQRVVSATQGGILTTLFVAEGEHVSAGQVMAEIRSPQLVEVQSRYLEAVGRLALAETELKRDESLYQEGVIAQRRFLETQSKQRELLTQVDQGRQLLGLAGLSSAVIEDIGRTRQLSSTLPIQAPITGVVLEQLVSTGQSVAAAAPLYRMAQLKPLWLEIHVPVDRVRDLKEGGRIQLPGVGTTGTIIALGRLVHAEDQGVLVRAEVTEGTERMRPGQFVEVQFENAQTEVGWRIPIAAVVRNAGEAFLFVARTGGFEVLPVQVLAEEEKTAVVAGALERQDQIAVSGIIALKAAWLGTKE
jgi:RND family efflux transporter MFP subunit